MSSRAAMALLMFGVLAVTLTAAPPPARMTAEQNAEFKEIAQLNGQVNALFPRNQYKQALPLAEQTLARSLALFGPDNRFVAIHRVNLATVTQQMGDASKALPQLLEAIRVLRLLGVEEDPYYIPCVLNLSLVYQRMEQYSKSLPLAEEALARALRSPPHPNREAAIINTLNNLAVLHRARGDLRKALPLLRDVADRLEAIKGVPTASFSIFLNNLGMVYHELGESRQALATFDKALRLLEKVKGKDTAGQAMVLNNLATIYRDVGDYREAVSLAQQAMDLFANTYDPSHAATATTYNNLATLHEMLGEYQVAQEWYEKAQALQARYRPNDLVERSRYVQGLGVLAQRRGELDRAEKLLSQALDQRRQSVGESHSDYAQTLRFLAHLKTEKGDYAGAGLLFDQAARTYLQGVGSRSIEYARTLNHLALALQAQGARITPLLVSEQALTSSQAYLEDTFVMLSERQRQEARQSNSSNLEVYLGLGLGLAPATSLYNWVIAIKGAALSRSMEERLGSDEKELQPLLGELRDVRARLGRLASQPPAAAGRAAWREKFDQLERQKEALQTRLSQASFEFRASRMAPTAAAVSAALEPGQKLVEFITYDHRISPVRGTMEWRSERRLVAFLLTRDREPVLIPLGAAEPIEQAVRLWRERVMDSEATEALRETGLVLRRAVWEPIEKHLGTARSVLLAPDGELATLPFAALPGREPNSYLLEEYSLSYLTSGRQLLTPPGALAKPASGLLALGGANYGSPDARGGGGLQHPWTFLPGTEVEAREVAARFAAQFPAEPRTILADAGADRDSLLRVLRPGRRWRYLHFGTHGYFEEVRALRNPRLLLPLAFGPSASGGLPGAIGALSALRVAREPSLLDKDGFDPTGRGFRVHQRNPLLACALVLADANRRAEGYLTAEEIASFDLRGCEVAALSACETGRGKHSGWQGVQGLQAGFHEAGVRNVLASLWGVSDAATCVLMEEFYTQLWRERQPPSEALRQAQLAVLRDPRRVQRRAVALDQEVAKRKLIAQQLDQRGIKPVAVATKTPEGAVARSPVKWWAAWVMSGPAR